MTLCDLVPDWLILLGLAIAALWLALILTIVADVIEWMASK